MRRVLESAQETPERRKKIDEIASFWNELSGCEDEGKESNIA
jgi:hypothetical protein